MDETTASFLMDIATVFAGKKRAFQPSHTSNTTGLEGQPILYVYGHNKRIRLLPEFAVPFKLDNVYCRLIPFTRDLYTIVDASDYDWLMQWKWMAIRKDSGFYALRGGTQKKRKREPHVYMHRQILGLGPGDPDITDHKDAWNTLNNSRRNLRPCNNEENGRNSRRGWLSKTGRKGVYSVQISSRLYCDDSIRRKVKIDRTILKVR